MKGGKARAEALSAKAEARYPDWFLDDLIREIGLREAIEVQGANRWYLPPYRPDLNPIEQAFAKLKALLRKAAKRSVESLWATIGEFLPRFSPEQCINYFAGEGDGLPNRNPL